MCFSQQLSALQEDPCAERSFLCTQPRAASSPGSSDANGPRFGAAAEAKLGTERRSDARRCCGWRSSGWDADKMSAAL